MFLKFMFLFKLTFILRFVELHPCIILQINPTRCKILPNIFISLLWSGLLADQTPPIHSDKYQCHLDTVILSRWWARGCPKHVAKKIKYIKQNCAPSWTYLQDNIYFLWKLCRILEVMLPKICSTFNFKNCKNNVKMLMAMM